MDDQQPEGPIDFGDMMRRAIEGIMSDIDGGGTTIGITNNYNYAHGEAYVVLNVDRPVSNLSPEHAIEIGKSLMAAGVRAIADSAWFEIMRENLADEMGNVRPFSEGDAEIIRELLQEKHIAREREKEQAQEATEEEIE